MASNVNYQQQLEQKQFFFRKGLERTWDAQEAKRVEKPWKPVAIVAGSLAAALCLLLLLTGAFAKNVLYVDGHRYAVTDTITLQPDGGFVPVGETVYSKKPGKEAADYATNWSEASLEVWRNYADSGKVYLYWQPGGYWQEARKR